VYVVDIINAMHAHVAVAKIGNMTLCGIRGIMPSCCVFACLVVGQHDPVRNHANMLCACVAAAYGVDGAACMEECNVGSCKIARQRCCSIVVCVVAVVVFYV
jgi:hypothetical protein